MSDNRALLDLVSMTSRLLRDRGGVCAECGLAEMEGQPEGCAACAKALDDCYDSDQKRLLEDRCHG